MQNLARMATTEAGLERGWLFLRDIPAPQVRYEGFTVRRVQGDGGEAVHGYRQATLTWINLNSKSANWIREIIESVPATENLFVTIPLTNASGIGHNWADVKGRPHIPTVEFIGDISGAKGDSAYTLEFVLNNISIVNSQSTAIEPHKV